MRPVSIELEGFFAYRSRARVDFTDVDYFSLEGPTGSGKSSLIDAMILALYGKVPRLGGATVAPAISAGMERARVSFCFQVGDTTYTATRQLERTASGGARATEVRLETEGSVLASGATEVPLEVTRLLNLSYEDFIRTVVLPQGEFARFLTATPKERQELLRGLLGLEVYRTMATLARNREQLASAARDSAADRLSELAVPDEAARELARERLASIAEMADQIAEAEQGLTALSGEVDAARADLAASEDALARLQALKPPSNLERLASLIEDLDGVIERRTEELEKTVTSHEAAVARLADLPTAERLRRFAELHSRREGVASELAAIDLKAVSEQLAASEVEAVAAQESLTTAQAALEEARSQHAAHALARTLVVGEPCPVCDQVVPAAPPTVDAGDLDTLEERVMTARSKTEQLREVVAARRSDLARLEAGHERLVSLAAELDADLSEGPDPELIPALLAEREEVASEVARLAEEVKEAQRRLRSTESDRAELSEERRSLSRRLMAARDDLADLKPPIAESEDVLIQWKELTSWRDEQIDVVTGRVAEREKRLGELGEALAAVRTELHHRLESLGIEAEGSPSVAVARAEEQAKQLVREHESLLGREVALRTEVETAGERAALAGAMARHLRADGFERWMMVGAISDLVTGANDILAELSGSSYSLRSDESGSFDIVDHRNADEVRPISTLSGGETFLVSLALALSLAETLSSGGGSNLDAIILDEGFGSLDEESLDVVASVLETLTVSGLMVGIITHVRALASRAPVRFSVRKGPEGSRIEVIE